MIRKAFIPLAVFAFACAPQISSALTCGFGSDIGGGQCRGYLTSGTSWTVPSDWNNANNTVEAIGAGGNGYQTDGGYSGGGGAYAKKSNLSLSGTISYRIGVGGGTTGSGTTPTANTWFQNGSRLIRVGIRAHGPMWNRSHGIFWFLPRWWFL